MKNWLVLSCIISFQFVSAQNVGIGTTNPTATLDVIRGTPGNEGTAIFRGTQHTSNFNYSTNEDTYIRAGKDNSNVILNDIPGGKVGIGTASPGFPLNFPNTLGDKISLYGNSGGHYGFGIQSNLLQIYSDAGNSDIAFGYGSSGSFTETMRIKGNGALAINGSTGSAGQVLKSNGASSPSWVSPTNSLYNNTVQVFATSVVDVTLDDTWAQVPGMTYSFTVTGNTKVVVMSNVPVSTFLCVGCGATDASIGLFLDGVLVTYWQEDIASYSHINFSINRLVHLIQVGSSTHTVSIRGSKSGPNARFGDAIGISNLTLQIIPE